MFPKTSYHKTQLLSEIHSLNKLGKLSTYKNTNLGNTFPVAIGTHCSEVDLFGRLKTYKTTNQQAKQGKYQRRVSLNTLVTPSSQMKRTALAVPLRWTRPPRQLGNGFSHAVQRSLFHFGYVCRGRLCQLEGCNTS